jgi:predicted amidohydrolase
MARLLGLAGVQMNVISGDGNLDNLKKFVTSIAHKFPWAELIVFSELCIYGGGRDWVQGIPGPLTKELCKLARASGKWLIPGSLHEQTDEGVYNTAVVINPKGEIVAAYRKLYPWEPVETVLPGDEFCVFDIPGKGRIGLCLAYDCWFPEVARELAYLGAELIINPCLTSTADRPLEIIMSRSHAIANQLFYFSINGLGDGGNGRSVLIGPEGRLLQEAGETITVLADLVDLDRVRQVREFGTMGVCRVVQGFKKAGHRFRVYGKSPVEDGF